MVRDAEDDLHRGLTLEEDVDRVAEAEILGAGADVEADARFALAVAFELICRMAYSSDRPESSASIGRRRYMTSSRNRFASSPSVMRVSAPARGADVERCSAGSALGLSTSRRPRSAPALCTCTSTAFQPCWTKSAGAGPRATLTRASGLICTIARQCAAEKLQVRAECWPPGGSRAGYPLDLHGFAHGGGPRGTLGVTPIAGMNRAMLPLNRLI